MRQVGTVVRVNVMENGNDLTIAIVLFEKAKDAQKAIELYNMTEYKGKIIQLALDSSLDHLKKHSQHDSSVLSNNSSNINVNNSFSSSLDAEGKKSVCVTNLPYVAGWQDLKDLFREAGKVIRADIKIDSKSGKSKGIGTVQFATAYGAMKAIEMFNGFEWFGRKIDVFEEESSELFITSPSTSTIPEARTAKNDKKANSKQSARKIEGFAEAVKSSSENKNNNLWNEAGLHSQSPLPLTPFSFSLSKQVGSSSMAFEYGLDDLRAPLLEYPMNVSFDYKQSGLKMNGIRRRCDTFAVKGKVDNNNSNNPILDSLFPRTQSKPISTAANPRRNIDSDAFKPSTWDSASSWHLYSRFKPLKEMAFSETESADKLGIKGHKYPFEEKNA
jgi:RNA recognition motif-containing protein